jgi:hypothetical protein
MPFTRIRIIFHGNILSAPEVVSFVINGIGGFNCIPFESIFRIPVIVLIGSSMCPGMGNQKNVVSEFMKGPGASVSASPADDADGGSESSHDREASKSKGGACDWGGW